MGLPPSAPEAFSELLAEATEVSVPTGPSERLLFGLLLVGVGLLLLAVLTACYLAAEIVLPIALAFVLMLVLRPAMRLAENSRIPRVLAALSLLVVLFGVAAALVTVLAPPAAGWAEKLPTALPKLQARLHVLSEPVAVVQKVISHAQHLAGSTPSEAMPVVAVEGSNIPQRLLGGRDGRSRT